MKYLFFANTAWYIYNFRLPLIDYVLSQGHDAVLVCPTDSYSERLTLLGYRVKSIEINRRGQNLFREIRVLTALIKLYRTERPDIAHHFTLRCVVYGCIASAFSSTLGRVYSLTGMGYAFTSSTLPARCLKFILLPLLKSLFLIGRGHVIVQNPTDYALLLPLAGRNSAHLHLIFGSGVDTAYFQPLLEQPVRDDRAVRVLMATRLLRDKGVYEFVDAARETASHDASIQFLLAGDIDPGNPTSATRQKVDNWASVENLTFLGHCEDMLSLYQSVDIVVLPSYREGLPRCLIEAAACALPVITTDVPGCNEVVEDGVTGFLVPPRNAQALTNRVIALAQSAPLRQQMGRLARERCIDRFDQEIIVRKTIGVYDILHQKLK